MPATRDAVSTLKGYYYQFDFFILKLLQASTDDTVVVMEGIEDVDIKTASETTAIQCKYYAGTDYNHSKIAEPIRYMLKGYVSKPAVHLKYKLYGYYKSGSNKLTLPLTVEFVKKHFLSYTVKGVRHEFHTEEGISDDQINGFIGNLDINLNALEYEEQENAIRQAIRNEFNVRPESTVDYYYNTALGLVRKLCTAPEVAARSISKGEFVNILKNSATDSFDAWFLIKKGRDKYCHLMRSRYFSSYNVSPNKRFFLIDAKGATVQQIVKIIEQIKNKYSKFGPRIEKPFSPYIYLHHVSDIDKASVMQTLVEDRIIICDGYSFKGASFDVKVMTESIKHDHRIDIRIIHSLDELNQIIPLLHGSKEIYQFYMEKAFYERTDSNVVKICISDITDINAII